MKVSSSRKASLRLICPKGPAPLMVAQTAKTVRIRATVEVSRGPRRNAAQTSGRIVRNPSGLVYSERGSSGLNPISPTATAHPSTATTPSNSRRSNWLQSLRPHSTSTRRHHQGAGGIAQPPGDPNRVEFVPGRQSRHAQRDDADGGADDGRRPDADQGEFRHPAGGRESVPAARPALQQEAADDALQRVAERDKGRRSPKFRRLWRWRRRRRYRLPATCARRRAARRASASPVGGQIGLALGLIDASCSPSLASTK